MGPYYFDIFFTISHRIGKVKKILHVCMSHKKEDNLFCSEALHASLNMVRRYSTLNYREKWKLVWFSNEANKSKHFFPCYNKKKHRNHYRRNNVSLLVILFMPAKWASSLYLFCNTYKITLF